MNEDAIEAAAEALCRDDNRVWDGLQEAAPPMSGSANRASYRWKAKRALEAAAPHLRIVPL